MPLFATIRYTILNAPCGSGPRGLGFESRHSDQKTGDHICGHRFFISGGIRKGGTSPQTDVNKCPVDICLVRGRILWFLDASLADVDKNQIAAVFETLSLHSDQKSGIRRCGFRIFHSLGFKTVSYSSKFM